MEQDESDFHAPGRLQKALIWKFYTISKTRGLKTRRYKAKCRYCTAVMDGKTQRMEKHSLNCKKVPPETRAELYRIISTAPSSIDHDDVVGSSSSVYAMRRLAVMTFKLKGHAAPVETLFSEMSYTKTKTRNRINVDNLKMFTMIRKDLMRSIPESKMNYRKLKNDGVVVAVQPSPLP